MTNWSLRLARRNDVAAMPAIEAAADRLFDDAEKFARTAEHRTVPISRLEDYVRKGHCLIAQIANDHVGFLASEPIGRELHIWQMSVLPAYQRCGIGTGLVRACMIDARNSGYSALTLTTFRDTPWNAPFYSALDFEEVTALDAHPRLAGELAAETQRGFPADRRCAMIRFLH